MFDKDVVMNTGTRAGTLAIINSEMTAIIFDARWMLLAIIICVIADFRYGWRESSVRFENARRKGDKVMMAQYKWRTSRAVRRTVNKFIDYFLWIAIGMFVGMATLEQMGISHNIGGLVAAAIAFFCEGKSFFGHFFYLHGIRMSENTVSGFFKSLAVALVKKKNEDVGEALEEAFEQTDNNKGKEKDNGNG